MDYKYMVEKIKEVTSLDVPVRYDNEWANQIETPFFGLNIKELNTKLIGKISNELDVINYVEDTHWEYFHIGLPKIILKRKHKFAYEFTQELLNFNNINIKLNRNSFSIFAILHEFGHAHQLYIQYNKNAKTYLENIYEETISTDRLVVSLGLLDTKEGLELHRSALNEEYADKFAVKYIRKVLELI